MSEQGNSMQSSSASTKIKFKVFCYLALLLLVSSTLLSLHYAYTNIDAANKYQLDIERLLNELHPTKNMMTMLQKNPLTSSNSQQQKYITLFPPYMFRTSETAKDISNSEKYFIQKCQRLNKNYTHVFYNGNNTIQFVKNHYPEFLDAYINFPRKVMQADMWRLLILHHFGGVYFDMDVECIKPIDSWGETFGIVKKSDGTWSATTDNDYGSGGNDDGDPRQKLQLLIGIEFVDVHQFTNWAIAAQPKNEIFYKAAKLIVQQTKLYQQPTDSNSTTTNGAVQDGEVIHLSGPKLWSNAVFAHLAEIGYLADTKNDTIKNAAFWHSCHTNTLIRESGVGILNKQAFGFHRLHKDGPFPCKSEMYIRHMFAGRWRGKSTRRI